MINSGIYLARGNAVYYVTRRDDEVYWLGEHKDGRWCHLFVGRIEGRIIQGQFVDLLKGQTSYAASRRYTILSADSFEIIGYGGEVFSRSATWPDSSIVRTSLRHVPGFVSDTRTNSVTGVYLSSDGSTTYAREFEGRVYMFTEPEQRETDSPLPWANVYVGEITTLSNPPSGSDYTRRIVGEYIDIPKGRATSSGRVELLASRNGASLSRVGSAPGGQATFWRRVESSRIVGIRALDLTVVDEQEGRGDEPAIYLCAFSADPAFIDFGGPSNPDISIRGAGTGNLGRNIDTGGVREISRHVGETFFHVTNVLNDRNAIVGTKVGMYGLGFEDDGVRDILRTNAERFDPQFRWGTRIRTAPTPRANSNIARFKTAMSDRIHARRGIPDVNTVRTSRGNIPDHEDFIGKDAIAWTFDLNNLARLGGMERNLRFSGDGATYDVRCRLSFMDDRFLPEDPPAPPSGGLAGGGGDNGAGFDTRDDRIY